MVSKRGRKPTGAPPSMRTTVSLPADVYSTLQDIAKQKKVSIAWVIRDASEKYISDQWPLLESRKT